MSKFLFLKNIAIKIQQSKILIITISLIIGFLASNIVNIYANNQESKTKNIDYQQNENYKINQNEEVIFSNIDQKESIERMEKYWQQQKQEMLNFHRNIMQEVMKIETGLQINNFFDDSFLDINSKFNEQDQNQKTNSLRLIKNNEKSTKNQESQTNFIDSITQEITENMLRYKINGDQKALTELKITINNNFLVLENKNITKLSKKVTGTQNQEIKSSNFYYSTLIPQEYRNISPVIENKDGSLLIIFNKQEETSKPQENNK